MAEAEAEAEPLMIGRETSIDLPESQYDALLGQDRREHNDEESPGEIKHKRALFAYLRTKQFWTILLLG
jgi:solute carrier family 35, member F1/2